MLSHTNKGRLACTALAGVVASLALTAGAPAAQPQAPQVPEAVQVEAGHKPYLVAHADGVQIYRCNGAAWSLLAPRADLADGKGKLIATHFGGPSWQARDGSTVVGERVDGEVVDPTAIPWLLIKAVSPTAGADGDKLVKTTFIQRINTVGGLAPDPATCNAATSGSVEEIDYTADYVFWKKG